MTWRFISVPSWCVWRSRFEFLISVSVTTTCGIAKLILTTFSHLLNNVVIITPGINKSNECSQKIALRNQVQLYTDQIFKKDIKNLCRRVRIKACWKNMTFLSCKTCILIIHIFLLLHCSTRTETELHISFTFFASISVHCHIGI